MGKKESAAIKVFARIRPVNNERPTHISVDLTDRKIEYYIPKDISQGYVNNTKEQYEFKFDDILDTHVQQDEVFQKVAQPIVDSTLCGYNGCVFAYGQTGSGKTFTITGGIERYVDRGLIPRTLAYVFEQFQKSEEYKYTMSISYMEIYNNAGYDLLSPDHEISKLEDLPKVGMREDADGKIHMHNLEKHVVSNEEDALNLLFLGDTNRAIGVTPMNLHSSRSHCIFTIHIEARKRGSDLIKRSKLHMVDLAGSERVYKTQVNGKLLTEANNINTSLHFLKVCIIALQKKEEHIPYRNSMMTAVLRDSLGGNSRTVMVATLSPSDRETEESISTCRFAQQVAMIENQIFVNEELDPKLLIARLKQEIRELKEELAIYKGNEASRGNLSDEELKRLRELVDSYLRNLDPNAEFRPGDMTKIRQSFAIFKERFLEVEKMGGKNLDEGMDRVDSELLKKMKLQLQQRDNEINILVTMLKQKGGQPPQPGQTAVGITQYGSENNQNIQNMANAPRQGLTEAVPTSKSGRVTPRRRDAPPLPNSPAKTPRDSQSPDRVKLPTIRSNPRSTPDIAGNGSRYGGSNGATAQPIQRPEDFDFLLDRNKAFETFRKSYRKNEVIEENKKILKEKYDAAKKHGETVNDARKKINQLKSYVEQLRVERAMQGGDENEADDPEEEKTKKMISAEKARYKESFDALKHCKSEIEHIQKLLERSRQQLQGDFEQWYSITNQQRDAVIAAQKNQGSRPPSSMDEEEMEVKGAWGGSANGYHRSHKPEPAPRIPPGTRPASSGANAEPSPSPAPMQRSSSGRVRVVTGNAEADQDIMAFYAAKEKLLQGAH